MRAAAFVSVHSLLSARYPFYISIKTVNEPTQHARNQLRHKFIPFQILQKQTEVLYSFTKFMIHPGAHHNKQLTHRPRYKVSRCLQ